MSRLATCPLLFLAALPAMAPSLDVTDALAHAGIGNVAIDDRVLSTEALHERLHAGAARDPGRPVRVDGAGHAACESIVQVFDRCRSE